MTVFIQILAILAIFIPTKYLTYMITEVWGLPMWLDYKPFNCNKCLTFWALIGIYITFWLSFSCLITGVGGILLAILNAIAMWYHQKTHTVKI